MSLYNYKTRTKDNFHLSLARTTEWEKTTIYQCIDECKSRMIFRIGLIGVVEKSFVAQLKLLLKAKDYTKDTSWKEKMGNNIQISMLVIGQSTS